MLEVLAIAIRQKKRNKRHTNWKGGSKSVIEDDMVVYIEILIDTTKKLLNLIREFAKAVRYKVDIQKFKAFLYTIVKYQKQKSGKKSQLL